MSQAPSGSGDDPFDPSLFRSIEMKVAVKNTTTKKEVRRKGGIQVVEILEAGMILDVPIASCGTGHYLVLHIDVTGLNRIFPKFISGGKVDKLETNEAAETERITVSLIQYDKKQWHDLCSVFEERQKEIESFFAQVKG